MKKSGADTFFKKTSYNLKLGQEYQKALVLVHNLKNKKSEYEN